jgi:diguanylate cyclase (GGDEF)-like protein
MTRTTRSDPEVQQLRALVTMSRELMQVDSASAALALMGRTLTGLVQAEQGLLLVRGDIDESIGFNQAGWPCRTDHRHQWHRMALERLTSGPDDAVGQNPRMILVRVPATCAIAVLAVGWAREGAPAELDRRRRLLVAILELTVATLGRIASRNSLEDLVSIQYEQMADTARDHADELARRDAAEDDILSLSLIDVLTGLNNRRGFFVQAETLFRLARRQRAACAVIYAAIDGLKAVNDQLGQAAGDELIRDAAAVLRESVRDTDIMARLGGSGFVVFTLSDARTRVIPSRLRDNLHAFNLMQERSYRLEVSAGIVQCDPVGDALLVDYVRQADRELHLHQLSCLH